MRSSHVRFKFAIALAIAPAIGLAIALCSACAGAAANGGARVSSPFSDADAKIFEDGVDFVTDPGALGGRWSQEAEREALDRIDAADAIAVVTITTLRTDIDPQQRTSYGLATNVVEKLKGDLGSNATLSVSSDALGFASVDREKQRILSEHLVAYVKWYAKRDGTVGAHFHLTIASPQVVQQVHERVDARAPNKNIVIERHSD